MSNLNVKASDKIAVVGVINPQTVANTELFSTVVDMSLYHQALGIAMLGDEANETVDFKCYRCASDGSGAVSLTAATQRAASATANDNKQILINVRSDDLIASGVRYVKFGLVTGGATGGPASVIVLGVDARYQPVTNLAAVVQVAG